MSTAMATTYENLILEIQDRVARVTISRPKVLNALNEKTVREIHAVFSSLRENADVGVVILTGAGEGLRRGRRHQRAGRDDATPGRGVLQARPGGAPGDRDPGKARHRRDQRLRARRRMRAGAGLPHALRV